MKGEERRKQLLNILSSSNNPVSGGTLAKELNVSRQIIVQDISLLRANGATIFSTNKGYLLQEDRKYSRVFKVYHTDDQVEEELSTIVDAGGQIRDVFVYHKVYGVLKADMGIKSRRDIRAYMEEISTGKSSLLKNVTSGYHYHTIDAESEEILDAIERAMAQLMAADQAEGIPDEEFDLTGYNTSFLYHLDQERSREIARIGMEDLDHTILYTLLFSPQIRAVELIYETDFRRERIIYTNGTPVELGNGLYSMEFLQGDRTRHLVYQSALDQPNLARLVQPLAHLVHPIDLNLAHS